MVPTQISCTFFPTGVFSGRFFLASFLTAFALLAVAQLYEIFKTCSFSSCTFVLLAYVVGYLYCASELMIPSLTGSLTGTELESLYGDVGQDDLFIFSYTLI